MRKMMAMLVVCVTLFTGSAQAAAGSFANREIGLSVGGFALLPKGADLVSWGLPIAVEGGYYIDSGFALYLHAAVMLLQQTEGFGPAMNGPGTVIAGGGQFGLRYLFLEESIRPYVMLHIAALYMARDQRQGYAGPGAGVGVDFFIAESVSLGVRATADLYITLNPTVLLLSAGGALYVTTYF